MQAHTPYSVHPSVAYLQALLANLEARTGLSAEGWVRLVQAKGPKGFKLRREWLKAQGLGGNQAALVAERSVEGKASAMDDTAEGYLQSAGGYVERQYEGKKAALRPLYELLLGTALASGPEAKACPCRTFVPLFRHHVFAQIKPSSVSRIDLGLALGDPAKVKAPGTRLLQTGGFAKRDRITHRFEVTRPSDVDATVRRWLTVAYERDA